MKRETGMPSIDKPWLKYYKENVEKTVIPDKTFYQFFKDNSVNFLDRPAMNYYGIRIDYKKYIERIEKSAKSLKEIGVKKGDIVPVCLPNIPESRIIIYALNLIGAISYPVSPTLPCKELEKILIENEVKNIFMFDLFNNKFHLALKNSNTNVVYTDGSFSIPKLFVKMKNLTNGKKDCVQIPTDDKYISWGEFSKLQKDYKNIIEPVFHKNDVATIIGTSGTTGTPKGVCLTNENINAMAIQHLIGDINFGSKDKILDILIQSIGYGIAVMHYSACGGMESIMVPELVTSGFPKLLCKTKPDQFTGGPIHYMYLVNSEEFKKGKIPKLKNMVSGGASLNKNIEAKLNYGYEDSEDNVMVRQGLGCTENGGVASYAKRGTYKFGGVGIPLPLDNISVFAPGTDKELGYNSLGEICISGPTVMKCYLNNKKETEEVLKLHSDGNIWLHTKDLGKMDEDGHIFIEDRIKNIFMRKGFNVHPSKISEFINSLTYIEDSIVVGIDHPSEQCVPVAFVKLKGNCTDEQKIKDAIKEACYNNLDETHIPYEIYIVNDFERNLGGKIDVSKLINQFQVNYYKPKVKEIKKY